MTDYEAHVIGDLTDDLMSGDLSSLASGVAAAAIDAVAPGFGIGLDAGTDLAQAGDGGGDVSDDSGSGAEPGVLDVVTTAVPDTSGGSVSGGASTVSGGGSAIGPGTTTPTTTTGTSWTKVIVGVVFAGLVAWGGYKLLTHKPKRANPRRRRRSRGRRR